MASDVSGASDGQSRKRRGRAPTRRRDRAATEERLLQAAIRTFSKSGFDRTTTRTIARTAGVNESLIIRYFGTKEGLLAAIIRRHVAEKQKAELGYPPQASLAAELLAYARWQVAQQQDDIDLVRIVISRALLDSKLRSELGVQNALTDQRLAARLVQLREAGAVAPLIDLQEVAYAVNTIVYGTKFFSTLFLGEPYESTLHRVEHLITLYAKGLSAP
jgi:AcrR family transcriptional regulator